MRARSCCSFAIGAMFCCTTAAAAGEEPLKIAGSQLEPITWTGLSGWPDDDHLAAFAAYEAGCKALHRVRRGDDRRPIDRALRNICRKALDLRPADSNTARTFFEENFQPVRIARVGEVEGLLTGYFEPIVQGSRLPNPEFHIPLYRRPRDLIAAGYRPGAAAFPNKGVRIGRRNAKGDLVPYYDRAAIEAGVLDGQKLEICWLRDMSDLTAIQTEGSGRIILEDGTPLRVNYDSHNGYSRTSAGGNLVKRNRMAREQASMKRIRERTTAYANGPRKAGATSRAYVFFRITGLSDEGEPVGAQGVPLTPGRSIAVDRQHDYGTPFFIEASLPIENARPVLPFHRLMIAQDTGSAIVGPARADLYWGAGDDAARIAGRIRHPGRFVMLLPRELDMIEAGKHMPLPAPRPKLAELEVRNHSGKANTRSAKPEVAPRAAAAYARWRYGLPY
jgi:membrane-bound lytic murein transglycosylase A